MTHVEYAYILVNGTIALATQKVNNPDNGDKEVLFKNCAPFTDCVSEINNNTQIDNAKDNDAVMPMHHLVVYSDNYSETSGSLWHYHRHEPALANNGSIVNFSAADNRLSFKLKKKTHNTAANGRKDVEMIVSLKYLLNFWRTLEMLLINCEINLIMTWSEICVLSNDKKAVKLEITDTKTYVTVVSLSTQDNTKLLQQVKSGFKRTIN